MWEESVSELKLSKADYESVKISSAPKTQRCPYFLKCGGCQLLNWDMTKQLAWKKNQLQEIFKSMVPCPIEIFGAQTLIGYRHKNSFSYQTHQYVTTGGFFKPQSRTLLPIEHCLIQHPAAEAIFLDLLKLMKANRIEAFDDRRQTGVLRHAVVRVSRSTGEIMLILVTGLSPYPGRKNFVQAIRKAHPEITTIVENVQTEDSPYLLGQKEEVLFGRGLIRDALLDRDFLVSSRSFFQIHPEQAEVLFTQAIKDLNLRSTDTLADVYAGVGVVGMLLADKVQTVLCVESNPDALNLAKRNADLNHLANLKFIRRDATEWIRESSETLDVVVMDPPREGAGAPFMFALKEKAPRTILYISCNPLTQKRDLDLILDAYRVEQLFGVDLFPQTVHVETVVLITRVKE